MYQMPTSLFTLLYSFNIHHGKDAAFIQAWSDMTQLLYQYQGSHGSRLYRSDETTFIGIAQWPDRETFSKPSDNLPEEAIAIRQTMRECCVEIKTLYELPELVVDMWQEELFVKE